MTSDGISRFDWEKVMDCVHDIIEASAMSDECVVAKCDESLFSLLDSLDKKYGLKPSLLAVRGDFSNDLEDKERFLNQAYSEAMKISDGQNLLLISMSLSELMIEELRNKELGDKWLTLFNENLKYSSDGYEKNRYKELKKLIGDL